jgi:dTDP-glucose 4,6-dehydratase
MRLLVTGGAGLIGSNLVRFLLEQPGIERVVCLDVLTYAGHLENIEPALKQPHFRFTKIDLREREAVLDLVKTEAITHVMHLAAESHVDRSIAGPGDFITNNILGTFYLLEACRAAWTGGLEGKRFLHVSTDEVYGSLGPTGYFTEISSYAPIPPILPARPAAISWCARIITHTVFRR